MRVVFLLRYRLNEHVSYRKELSKWISRFRHFTKAGRKLVITSYENHKRDTVRSIHLLVSTH